MVKNYRAFTLVELVVVITIISILGTIAFLSFQDYSQDSRNSLRITDIGLIKTSLSLFNVKTGKYPKPSGYTEVTYSGGLALYHGSFGNDTFRNVSRLNKIPEEPLNSSEYSYSVINSLKKYQVGTIVEGDLLGSNLNYKLNNKVNASSNSYINSYVTGDYELNDITIKTGGNCYNVTFPSIIINNLPIDGQLLPAGVYKFVYDKSLNLPKNYESEFDDIGAGRNFQINEVLNKCTINSLNELDNYINNLSTSYHQINGEEEFYELIFNSQALSYKLKTITNLKINGIKVSNEVIEQLSNSAPDLFFTDSFSGNDNDELIGSHNSDTMGTRSGINTSGYLISSNSLKKANNINGLVFPNPNPVISSPDYKTSFNIIDFAGGDINILSRYIDDDNYYGVNLTSSGYTLFKKVSGTVSVFSDVNEVINNNSSIELLVSGKVIKLTINNDLKEEIIDDSISGIGKPAFEMVTENSIIDDFNLTYK